MAGPNVELPADDDVLEALLRTNRLGPPAPWQVTPWDFVLRWPETVLRDRVWPIVSRLLIDEDDTVRARAIEFVRQWSDSAPITMPRILEVAEQHSNLYADQKPEGVTLRYELAQALSARVDRINATDRVRAVTLLVEMAKHEPVGATILGRYEPAFVAAQARTWGDSAPQWIEAASRAVALYRRDDVLDFLQGLRGLSSSTRVGVLAAVEEYIERDDQKASVLAQSAGLPAPTKLAPTPSECRSAIGL